MFRPGGSNEEEEEEEEEEESELEEGEEEEKKAAVEARGVLLWQKKEEEEEEEVGRWVLRGEEVAIRWKGVGGREEETTYAIHPPTSSSLSLTSKRKKKLVKARGGGGGDSLFLPTHLLLTQATHLDHYEGLHPPTHPPPSSLELPTPLSLAVLGGLVGGLTDEEIAAFALTEQVINHPPTFPIYTHSKSHLSLCLSNPLLLSPTPSHPPTHPIRSR